MNKFAFINHYLNMGLALERLPGFGRFTKRALKSLISYLPPYHYMDFSPVNSLAHTTARGIGIACPLLPEHFVTINPSRVLKKIVESARIGERFGAKIVGLGGFTSVFGNEGEEVARHLHIAVTSGNTYTAALAVQGLLAAAELMELRIADCKIAIIGATGDIGSICTKLLAKRASELSIAARNEKRLVELANSLNHNALARIRIEKYTTDAIRSADLVLTATSALTTIIDPKDLKPGTIVCDVAYPANIPLQIWRYRDDVLAFEGGLATWPYYNQLQQKEKLQKFSPSPTVHGCLAETMILALEGKFVNFSLGRGRITEEGINEITGLAQKHGFGVAPLFCGSKWYSPEDIKRIRYMAKTSAESKASAHAIRHSQN